MRFFLCEQEAVMNRINFGKLIRSLRLAMRFYEPANEWSLEYLAERTGIDPNRLRRLEGGVRIRCITGSEIASLANHLRLTAGERRELILASYHLFDSDLVLQTAETKTVEGAYRYYLHTPISFLKSYPGPGMIHDQFGDVIAINQCMRALMGVSDGLIDASRDVPAGFNIMRMVFQPEMGFVERVGKDSYDRAAARNILFFREHTLRYRFTEYFALIFAEMLTWGDFWRNWQGAPQSSDQSSEASHRYKYKHDRFRNQLDYITAHSIMHTPYGVVRTIFYLPANASTREAFVDLSQSTRKEDITYFVSWPKSQHGHG